MTKAERSRARLRLVQRREADAVASPRDHVAGALNLWIGRLFLLPGEALYVGCAPGTSLHSHHAIQVCVGAEGPCKLWGGSAGTWASYDVGVVPSDVEHVLDAGETRVALLYIDPETVLGRRMSLVYGELSAATDTAGLLGDLRARIVASCEDALSLPGAVALRDAMLDLVIPASASARGLDARVARTLDRLRNTPGEMVSVGELADAVALSPSRFAHLFRDNTGVPVRRYLLWLRLVEAVRLMASAASLTEVAHAAGFADSAHLTRTFRRMFGISPSLLQRGSTLVYLPGVGPFDSRCGFEK